MLSEAKAELTPVTNPQRLFRPGIEHGGNNKEAGRDGTFASPQNSTNDEETCEVLARRVTQESD